MNFLKVKETHIDGKIKGGYIICENGKGEKFIVDFTSPQRLRHQQQQPQPQIQQPRLQQQPQNKWLEKILPIWEEHKKSPRNLWWMDNSCAISTGIQCLIWTHPKYWAFGNPDDLLELFYGLFLVYFSNPGMERIKII